MPQRGPGFYAALAVGAFVCELLLLWAYIANLQTTTRYGSYVLTVVAYGGFGLVAAVLLFGALRSTGKFRGQKFGIAVEFGGPAALFITFLGVGLYFELLSRNDDFLMVFALKDRSEAIVDVGGDLFLELDKERITVPVSHGVGRALAIRRAAADHQAGIKLQVPGWAATDLPTSITLRPDAQINIHVQALPSPKPLSDDPAIKEGYEPGPGDPTIWGIEDRVNTLRGSWETVSYRGKGKLSSEVLERATQLAQELRDVDDHTLGPSGRFIKPTYACYAFIMAATTEPNPTNKTTWSQNAVDECLSAREYLSYVWKNKDLDASFRYVARWAREKEQEQFVVYLSAMATCVHAEATHTRTELAYVKAFLSRLPTPYLERYPPKSDWVLRPCI